MTLDDVSVSPDGRTLAVTTAAPGGLWLRDLDALEWRRLPGTEGASAPFWSPDSRYVGFIVDNTLRRVDTTGGPSETVISVPAAAIRSGAWNRHGDIVLGSWGGGSGGPLWRVSPAGGAATAVTEVDLSKGEFVHTCPTFLPDGNHFLYFRSGPPDVEGMYVGSLDVDAAEPVASADIGHECARDLRERLPVLSARRHADGTTIRRPPPAAPGRSGACGRERRGHVVLHRNVLGGRRRRSRLSDRIGAWHLPAHLG